MVKKDKKVGRISSGVLLATLGIVYGDIGTSPLYAFRECFYGEHATTLSPENILGILSLIFWALILVISLKYLFLVLRADHHGEGGVLALMQSALETVKKGGVVYGAVLTCGLFGAALLYGDGILTPAISVLSAVEGIGLIAPHLGGWIIPLTVLILTGLFAFQRFGTGRIGRVFGPVMVGWFILLAALGVYQICLSPEVLAAVNPMLAIRFLLAEGGMSLFVLGAIFLVVTGGEALYADLGHFGAQAIRRTWFGLVLPALLLNYFGQGALLLRDASKLNNPFYGMVSETWLVPLVILSTLATIIASQAIISGVFSLTFQAIQMHYLPRLRVVHTSSITRGQVYLPAVNWLLYGLTICVVLLFRSSANLAVAYGIAITLTMVITDVLLYAIMRRRWGWSPLLVLPLILLFLLVDGTFLAANALKIVQGGWFPLMVAGLLYLCFRAWIRGKAKLKSLLRPYRKPFNNFIATLPGADYFRPARTSVYLTADADTTPAGLMHNLEHNRVLHKRIILLTINFITRPTVPEAERREYELLTDGFERIILHYGYRDRVDMPTILKLWEQDGILAPGESERLTFFLLREHLLNNSGKTIHQIDNFLYLLLARGNQPLTKYFDIPPRVVFEIGARLILR